MLANDVSGLLRKGVYVSRSLPTLAMTSQKSQELKYNYRFSLAAKPVDSSSEPISRLELQSYIYEMLGIAEDKSAEKKEKTE